MKVVSVTRDKDGTESWETLWYGDEEALLGAAIPMPSRPGGIIRVIKEEPDRHEDPVGWTEYARRRSRLPRNQHFYLNPHPVGCRCTGCASLSRDAIGRQDG